MDLIPSFSVKYMFEYPKSERLVTENGQNFFDS